VATYGSQPGFGRYWYSGTNTQDQIAFLGTMPADGYITAASFNATGVGGTAAGTGMVWSGTGTILYQGGGVTLPEGASSTGALTVANSQAWNTDSGGTPVLVRAGTSIYIGWWRNPSATVAWPAANSGTEYVQSTTSGSPTTFSPSTQAGAIGAYITYTPVSPPTVTTGAATGITSTSATLNGSVTPNSADTHYQFGWGPTAGLGNLTTLDDAGSGTSGVPVSANLPALSPGTEIFFQLQASNADGGASGSVLNFTTLAENPPVLVSPANNAVVDAAAGFTASWTYEGSYTQTGYAFAVTVLGVTSWWTGSGWTSSETYVTSAAQSVTFTAGQWVAADNGLSYQWQVSTEDSSGTQPYSAPFTLIAEGAPYAPTLLSPANNAYADPQNDPITFQFAPNPNGTATPTGYIFKVTQPGLSPDQGGTQTGTTTPATVTATGTDGGTGRLIIVVVDTRLGSAGANTVSDNVNGLGVGTGINTIGDDGASSLATHHHSVYVTTATTGPGYGPDQDAASWTATTNHAGLCIQSYTGGAYVGKSALATGSTTVTPTYGSATKGNLLTACVTSHCTTSSTLTGSSAGWTRRQLDQPGTVETVEIWDKTAAGSDTMPTWNFASGTLSSVIVTEFSGVTTTYWNSATHQFQGTPNVNVWGT
jgi:hypothetical protein